MNFERFEGKPARLTATNNLEYLYQSAKSKYIPASDYNIINTLKKDDGKKYIIVGTPCQIQGIKNFLEIENIPDNNLLFLGLFCEKTLNFNILKYYEDVYRTSGEKISKYQFKSKEKSGWPGDSKLCFDSGRTLFVDKKIRMELKKFFQLKRCLLCLNGRLNPLADLSFGDCYIEGESDFYGKSSVIIRTSKGKNIFNQYSHFFKLKSEDMDRIKVSQFLSEKSNTLEYVKIFLNKTSNGSCSYKVDEGFKKEFDLLEKNIGLGKNYQFYKVRLYLFLFKFKVTLERFLRFGITGLFLIIAIIKFIFKRNYTHKNNTNNIVIIGGQLFNKGAQAMTFTAVDQLKIRFPEKNIYLFSVYEDYKRSEKEKENYQFKIRPWFVEIRLILLGIPYSTVAISNFTKNDLKNFIEILKNTSIMVDISGYGISSQFGFLPAVYYHLNIILAKLFSIKYYILPQSMGPFDYRFIYKIFLFPLFKLCFKYPEKVFIREKEGYNLIKKFTKHNLSRSVDMVLQNGNYNLENIFVEPNFKDIEIVNNSIGIIPNLRVFERSDANELYQIYKTIIDKCTCSGKIVYILRHSFEDLKICENLKNMFLYDENVILIPDDLNVFELENVIKNFDLVIASRYHSIVHAYKNGIPALVIGWADKYNELLKDFNQLEYLFDVRNRLDTILLYKELDQLLQHHQHESGIIRENLNSIKDNKFNIFDEVTD